MFTQKYILLFSFVRSTQIKFHDVKVNFDICPVCWLLRQESFMCIVVYNIVTIHRKPSFLFSEFCFSRQPMSTPTYNQIAMKFESQINCFGIELFLSVRHFTIPIDASDRKTDNIWNRKCVLFTHSWTFRPSGMCHHQLCEHVPSMPMPIAIPYVIGSEQKTRSLATKKCYRKILVTKCLNIRMGRKNIVIIFWKCYNVRS